MRKTRFVVFGLAALSFTTGLPATLAYAVETESVETAPEPAVTNRHAIATVKPSPPAAPGAGPVTHGIVTVPPPKTSAHTSGPGPVTGGIVTVPPKASTPASGSGPVTSGIATVPPKASAAPVAPSAAVNIPNQQAAAAAMKASASTPPPPSSPHTFKHGECPLTRDSSGTWRGPDGVAVDAATATMGDCKPHSK